MDSPISGELEGDSYAFLVACKYSLGSCGMLADG